MSTDNESFRRDHEEVPTVDSRTEAAPKIAVIGYHVLGVLGEGGFGVVYDAEQLEPVRRRVALKVIKAGMDSKAVLSRFSAERQALALMDHSNIARVYDAGQTEQHRPYVAMELVKGEPITDYCDRHKLDLRERVELMIPVCQAVQHAHQKGVVHRDLKPSNILVTLVDGQAVPKVIDFGVAKALERELTDGTLYTEQGQLIGTPEYMSPEQAEMTGLDIDTRSDIYSLGVILYEILAGILPFDSKTLRQVGVAAIQKTIREVEPPKPSSKLSTIGESASDLAHARQMDAKSLTRRLRGDLDWITLKCLEKDRTRRYETANGLATDLRRYLDGEAVLAGPPGLRYKAGKFIRRYKVPVAAAFVVVLLLLAGVTGTSLMAVAAERARAAATSALHDRDSALEAEAEQRRIASLARDHAEQEAIRALAAEQEAEHRAEQMAKIAYAGQLSRAFRIIDDRPAAAIRLLSDPDICPVERRGLAWRYLWHKLHPRQARSFQVHDQLARGLAASPDGSVFATSSIDGSAYLWSATTGRRLFDLGPFGNEVNAIAISPDGDTVCVGDADGVLRVIEIQSGRTAHEVNVGDLGVSSIAFSPDGRWLALGTGSGFIQLWDPDNMSEPIRKINNIPIIGHSPEWPKWITGVAFSPDGDKLLALTHASNVSVWDIREETKLVGFHSPRPRATDDLIHAHAAAVWSPDGSTYAMITYQGHISVYNADTGELIWSRLTQGINPIDLCYKRDGSRLAVAGLSGLISIIHVSDGREIMRLADHQTSFESVAYLGDSDRIVSIDSEAVASITEALFVEDKTLRSMDDSVAFAAISREGRRVVAGLRSGVVQSRFTDNLAEAAVLGTHADAITAVNLSPNDRYAASCDQAGLIQVWDLDQQSRMTSIQMDHEVRLLAWSADSDSIVAAGGHYLSGFELKAPSSLWTERLQDPIFSVSPIPDTSLVVLSTGVIGADSGGFVPFLFTKDLKARERTQAYYGHNGHVVDTAVSPDGSMIASAGNADHTARLWDSSTTEELNQFSHDAPVTAVAFADQGRTLVTATSNGKIHLWSAGTGFLLASMEVGSSWIADIDTWGMDQGLVFTELDEANLRVTAGANRRVTLWGPFGGENATAEP